MLDYFAIFHKGGALLWTLQFTTALKHNPLEALNALIRTCLLEERSGESVFHFTPKSGAAQSVKWAFHNGLGLVFVAVYQKTLSLTYVDELLGLVRDAFTESYSPSCYSYEAFGGKFSKILRDCEARADAARRNAAVAQTLPKAAGAAAATAAAAAAASRGAGQAGGKTAKAGGDQGTSDDSSSDADDAPAASANGGGASAGDSSSGEEGSGTDQAGGFDLAKLKTKSGKRRTAGATQDSSKAKPALAAAFSKKKTARTWGGMGRKDENERIDFSEGAPPPASAFANGAAAAEALGASRMEEEEGDWDSEDEEMQAELAAAAGAARGKANGAAPKARGVLGSFVSNLALRVVGSSALTADDLAPALVDMKRKLMERNVAEEIAGKVVDSVAQSLEGQKLSSFTGVAQFVRRAFEDSISGILNKRQVDVLHDIKRKRAKGQPYVIVFCGVNGVGKSTNLAKIAYWLGSQGLKVQLAACDTFRAGAVEQLKTHAAKLGGVPLYERGYEKDPAKVAAEAIKVAQRDGRDVVLVDTAGRMQDNEPLMRALSNLIALNEPDLVLFVGEALVGNDAVDQLVKFNRSLADLAPNAAMNGGGKRQVIDGIVLTKFDTIDDKVGAALSMVYASGAPVMFVGCGQTYRDLMRLNVRSVVRSLLK